MQESSRTTERTIQRLAAIGVRVPSPAETAHHLREMLDFTVVPGAAGAFHLTCRGDYAIGSMRRLLTLRPANRLELAEVTFEVVGESGLTRLRERLASRNLEVGEVEQDEEGERGIRFVDPQGLQVLCRLRSSPLEQPLPPSDIRPRRLGHVNLKVPDATSAATFYQEVLGLRLSEQVGELLYFLRATSEHHNFGFRSGAERPDIHHIAFEIAGWESFRIICDHLADHGYTVEYGPGRHGPGNNLFVYVVEPTSGLRFELYSDMAHIHDDETYTPPRWESLERARSINRWGPGPPESYLE
jgi:catechol 2,3-dioxygenase-like lactoylglutathione lyase family enzyme